MVHFVGAGPGDPELCTVRGIRLLSEADTVIYAGSLVNPALLTYAKADCKIYNSASMTLEEIVDAIKNTEGSGGNTVRIHTGDPSLYSAIGEQIALLDKLRIPWDVIPGVSAFSGAAASLGMEYTLPGVSQTLILTRMEGRTPVPALENLVSLAAHHASLAIYLSVGMVEQVREALLRGGYASATPAAIVYKATWPEEKKVLGTVGSLVEMASSHHITKTALILAGDFLNGTGGRSCLYDAQFSHEFRQGTGH